MTADIQTKNAVVITKAVSTWLLTLTLLGVISGMFLGTIVPGDPDPLTTMQPTVSSPDIDSSFTALNDSDDDQEKDDEEEPSPFSVTV